MKQVTNVGSAVSMGQSMTAIRQPSIVIVAGLFKTNHTDTGRNQLIQMLHHCPSEVRIVMEHTGAYWRPLALALVNAMLIHDFRAVYPAENFYLLFVRVRTQVSLEGFSLQ